MQWHVRNLGHIETTMHELQTCNEQEKKSNNHSTTQNTFFF